MSRWDYGKLCHLLQKMDFQSLEDGYVSPELHGRTIVVRVALEDAEEKIIGDYGDWEPVELWALQEAIDAIANRIEWKAVDESSLMTALELGHVERVKALIAEGASVNGTDQEGATLLMIAARKGHANIVRVLLDAGADIEATMEGGTNALLMAGLGGDAETVGLLLEAGAKPPSNPAHGLNFLGLRGFVWVSSDGKTV